MNIFCTYPGFCTYPVFFHLSGFDCLDWREFDDATVSSLSEEYAQSSDAYLLFYKQRGTITKQLLADKYDIIVEEEASQI
jgi:hypothetical protein